MGDYKLCLVHKNSFYTLVKTCSTEASYKAFEIRMKYQKTPSKAHDILKQKGFLEGDDYIFFHHTISNSYRLGVEKPSIKSLIKKFFSDS